MNIANLIRRKRDGHSLSDDEIRDLIRGYADDTVPDYQMSAFAMAVFFRGMSRAETTCLTECMLRSGKSLSWQAGPPLVDKHSTGGIGDKVSIVLAPLLAASGLRVPMISGRGLGPTGGTLDKLESIPGFRTDLSLSEIQSTVDSVGAVITGATREICPADRKLYALRDVTATVESIPLITASIMSKKLAENLNSLVLDVKVGSGSFMKTVEDGLALAESLVQVGHRMQLNTKALLTDMNQPLGRMIGNANEVHESIECLQGQGPTDLRNLVIALGSCLLRSAENMTSEVSAKKLSRLLESGAAFEKFEQMVQAQGGDLASLQKTGSKNVVTADHSGIVQAIDGRELGNIIIDLGGGRKTVGDSIDHSVGIEILVRIGETIDSNQPLAHVFAAPDQAERVVPRIKAAIRIGTTVVTPPPLIYHEIGNTL